MIDEIVSSDEMSLMTGIVLVGVDSTNTALAAAEKAAGLAVALNKELHVVSAYGNADDNVPRVQLGANPEQVAAIMDEHRDTLAQLRAQAQNAANTVADTLLNKFAGLQVQARAIEGPPGLAILKESKDLDAEMVVVGNRNVQGASRILGSIATVIAREIHCDLLIVNTRQK